MGEGPLKQFSSRKRKEKRKMDPSTHATGERDMPAPCTGASKKGTPFLLYSRKKEKNGLFASRSMRGRTRDRPRTEREERVETQINVMKPRKKEEKGAADPSRTVKIEKGIPPNLAQGKEGGLRGRKGGSEL